MRAIGKYFVPLFDDTEYTWTVTGEASITSGQGSHQVNIDWEDQSGDVQLDMNTPQGSRSIEYPVKILNSLVKNTGFEKGTKYWKKIAWPAVVNFELMTSDVHKGDQALYVNVTTPGTYPWDAQLSQGDLSLEAGSSYTVSLWAKSTTNNSINVAVINSSDYTIYGSSVLDLTNNWTHCEFSFTASVNAVASLNIDMGDHTGEYCFDDVMLIPPENYPPSSSMNREDFSSVMIYPNPTEGILYIENPGKEENNTIQIFNILGKTILSSQFTECCSFNIRQFPSGIYYVKIGTEGHISIKEIIKK